MERVEAKTVRRLNHNISEPRPRGVLLVHHTTHTPVERVTLPKNLLLRPPSERGRAKESTHSGHDGNRQNAFLYGHGAAVRRSNVYTEVLYRIPTHTGTVGVNLRKRRSFTVLEITEGIRIGNGFPRPPPPPHREEHGDLNKSLRCDFSFHSSSNSSNIPQPHVVLSRGTTKDEEFVSKPVSIKEPLLASPDRPHHLLILFLFPVVIIQKVNGSTPRQRRGP